MKRKGQTVYIKNDGWCINEETLMQIIGESAVIHRSGVTVTDYNDSKL